VEDLLKIKKSVAFRKPTLIEIYEFNAFESYEFGIEYEQEEDFNVNPRDISKGLIKKGQSVVCYEYPASAYQINVKK
jgi:hypothetical protein